MCYDIVECESCGRILEQTASTNCCNISCFKPRQVTLGHCHGLCHQDLIAPTEDSKNHSSKDHSSKDHSESKNHSSKNYVPTLRDRIRSMQCYGKDIW
jgi:hypothetical protein